MGRVQLSRVGDGEAWVGQGSAGLGRPRLVMIRRAWDVTLMGSRGM